MDTFPVTFSEVITFKLPFTVTLGIVTGPTKAVL